MEFTRKDFDLMDDAINHYINDMEGVAEDSEIREFLAVQKKIERYINSPEFAKKQTEQIRSTATKLPKKKLKLEGTLKEVSAEIVQGKIPARKVFDLKGNVVSLDQLKGSESQALLVAIKTALEKSGLLKNFNPENLSSLDIKPFKKNSYVLTPDVGAKKYLYNVATGQITEA